MGGRSLANSHTPYKHALTQTHKHVALLSSVIKDLARGSETHTHTHTRCVVSRVVKSHCSKQSVVFDQHYERTAQASGRPAKAAICAHQD